jgi:putative phosphoribosyl transferase
MPPPERVLPDRRQEAEDEAAAEEIREALAEQPAPPAPSAVPSAAPPPPQEPRSSWSSFRDRIEAGEALAAALGPLVPPDTVVLAIPRGGLDVAVVIAEHLDLPLDIVVPRKLGAPGNPELGLGAVAEGVRVLDDRLIRSLGVSVDYLEEEIEKQTAEIRRRTEAYREGRPPVAVEGGTALIVDDGVATGGTAIAAIRWARRVGAREVVFAAPVAPREAVRRLEEEADRVVVLSTPSHFFAVGQWYVDFPQVSDDRVVALLRAAAER